MRVHFPRTVKSDRRLFTSVVGSAALVSVLAGVTAISVTAINGASASAATSAGKTAAVGKPAQVSASAPQTAAAGPAQARSTAVQNFVSAAKRQIGVTTLYDPAYVRLSYPGGDVPMERGVCTDVVIRAYRAIGVDLQVLVHQDMQKSFSSYPRTGLAKPDANIDHRRVKNLLTFFTRKGAAVAKSQTPADYLPGDVVMWDVSGLAHTGLVVDELVPGTTRHFVVHNIGDGAQMEDIVFAFPITGHFRYFPV